MANARVGPLVMLLVVLAATACDPCSGVTSCRRAPFAAVVGRIVDGASGLPVEGVRVELSRDSGVLLTPSARSATTGSNGVFELELDAAERGVAWATITVSAPGRRAYTVSGVGLPTFTTSGDATVLRPWVSADPVFPYVLVLQERETQAGIPNAIVTFRRTEGPPLIYQDEIVNAIAGTTDANGWLFLLRPVTTDRTGVVTGDLTIGMASGDSLVLRQVTWTAVPEFRPATVIVVVPVD